MTSRSDCEPLPKPTLSPFALARPGTFLRVGFFTAAVWCVPALRVPLVHSLINHFRKKTKNIKPKSNTKGARRARRTVLKRTSDHTSTIHRSQVHAVTSPTPRARRGITRGERREGRDPCVGRARRAQKRFPCNRR